MGKRATFTKAELTRAITAAQAAGLAITRCEIGPDGTIVLSSNHASEAPKAAYDTWKVSKK